MALFAPFVHFLVKELNKSRPIFADVNTAKYLSKYISTLYVLKYFRKLVLSTYT